MVQLEVCLALVCWARPRAGAFTVPSPRREGSILPSADLSETVCGSTTVQQSHHDFPRFIAGLVQNWLRIAQHRCDGDVLPADHGGPV